MPWNWKQQHAKARASGAELQDQASALAKALAAATPSTRAQVVGVPLPLGCGGYGAGRDPLAVVLDGVFSKDECDALVALAEHHGFDHALINTGSGHQMRVDDVRNNKRAMVDSPEIAEALWQRVKHAVPGQLQGWHALGLNERLRFLRYHPGERFAPHADGVFRRGGEAGERAGEESKLTFQLYLQESEGGGATNFLGRRGTPCSSVRPVAGRVLLFEHALMHEGEAVGKGVKYSLRTDVMYTRKGPGLDYAAVPVRLARPGQCSPVEP